MQQIEKNKLKAKIVEKGFTQTTFAEKIGLSPTSFSYKINSKVDFSLTEIQKMCDVLGLSHEERQYIFFL